MKEKLNGSEVLSQEVWRVGRENIYIPERGLFPLRHAFTLVVTLNM